MRGWGAVLALLAALAVAVPVHAQLDADIDVIVAPDVPLDTLTVNQLRLIFALRLRNWPNGAPIRVVTEPDDHDTHQVFCRTRLGVYANSLRIAWNRLIYTGMAAGPIVVNDSGAMLERVATLPGAIGYVSRAGLGDARVRVVTIVTPELR